MFCVLKVILENIKKQEIINFNEIKLNKKTYIYHAGTKFVNHKLLSVGGRVLNVTAVGSSFSNIRYQILKTLRKINWKGGFSEEILAGEL